MPSTRLVLTSEQRTDLETRARSRRGRADAARRARVILLLADGGSSASITAKTGCSSRTIALWKRRFEDDGIAGLAARHRGSKPTVLTPALQARILAWTRRAPPHGVTHWSTRSLGRKLGVQHTIVARAWRDAGLQPHRLERYMRSTDPDFETKAAVVIGLYLDPPQHAVVLCIDEKTAIQALDREDPVLPLSPGRAERHGFEYYRHGTLSLYAALDVATGRVAGMPAARHSSADFLAFMTRLAADYGPRRELHVILDNLSAHKTKAVEAWLAAHRHVRFHFTPTYSSWLNQVELWFAKIERDLIARGIFTSVSDLRKKLVQYIKLHNKTAQPFQWTYSNPKHRVRAIRNSDVRH